MTTNSVNSPNKLVAWAQRNEPPYMLAAFGTVVFGFVGTIGIVARDKVMMGIGFSASGSILAALALKTFSPQCQKVSAAAQPLLFRDRVSTPPPGPPPEFFPPC